MQTAVKLQPVVNTASAKAAAVIVRIKVLWSELPGSIRFAAPVAVLIAGVLAAYLLWGSGESFVNLQVHHGFKSAEVKVTVDGWTKHTGTMSGTTSRKIFTSRVSGLYSKQLSLRPGKHTIVVEVTAPGYDQSRTVLADLTKDSETVLDVNCGRTVSASLREQDQHSYASTSGAIRSNPMTSLILTICGSAMSAIIGFYVQEFLRSRKKA